MTNRNLPELKALASKVGQFIQYWGFKRVHGEIWTYIYLSEEPVDATLLVKKLGVSKALVSLAVKDLLHYDVIRVAGKGGRRKILLESNPDPFAVITNILGSREAVMLKEAGEAYGALRAVVPEERREVNADRLKDIGDMIELAETTLAAVVASKLDFVLEMLSDEEKAIVEVGN